MGDKDRSHRHKHSEHKSKRKHGNDEERHSKKKHRKESKSKVDIIDDDMEGDMWIEKNIDTDGVNVRMNITDSVITKSLKYLTVAASRIRHPNRRKPQTNVTRINHNRRLPSSIQTSRNQTQTRRMDAHASVGHLGTGINRGWAFETACGGWRRVVDGGLWRTDAEFEVYGWGR
jgi:hypothetical protein